MAFEEPMQGIRKAILKKLRTSFVKFFQIMEFNPSGLQFKKVIDRRVAGAVKTESPSDWLRGSLSKSTIRSFRRICPAYCGANYPAAGKESVKK
ncbi:MAG: hypothetical protein H6963_11645 [Chromatiaceae bacterium]|nr:hypothetical protein [Chromatiaceae bacterium]